MAKYTDPSVLDAALAKTANQDQLARTTYLIGSD